VRFIIDEKLIWTNEEYKSEARRITTGRVLRIIVNQSSTMTDNTMTDNTMTDNNMTDNTMTDNTMTDNTMTDNTIIELLNTAYDRAIRNMKNKTTNILRGAN